MSLDIPARAALLLAELILAAVEAARAGDTARLKRAVESLAKREAYDTSAQALHEAARKARRK